MSRKLVVLQPMIVFDPQETGWIRVSDYEKWYARSLNNSGLEGERLEVAGQPWSCIYKISKTAEAPQLMQKDTARPVKEQIERARQKIKGVKK